MAIIPGGIRHVTLKGGVIIKTFMLRRVRERGSLGKYSETVQRQPEWQ